MRVNERGGRRFKRAEVLGLLSGQESERQAVQVAAYVRVSGRGDQLSSLAAQEAELRASEEGEVVAVYTDIGSGLNERRRGLDRLLVDAERGQFDVVVVTHADRLARFGVQMIERLLAAYGVRLVVLHERETAAPEQELVDDFMSLLASFSGRLYGQRSTAAKRQLLNRARMETSS